MINNDTKHLIRKKKILLSLQQYFRRAEHVLSCDGESSTLFWSDKSLEGLVLIKKPSVSETLQGLCCFQGLSMDMTVKGLVSWSSLSQLHLHNSLTTYEEKKKWDLWHTRACMHTVDNTHAKLTLYYKSIMQLKLKGFVHQWDVLTLWVQLLIFSNLHSTEIIKMEIG